MSLYLWDIFQNFLGIMKADFRIILPHLVMKETAVFVRDLDESVYGRSSYMWWPCEFGSLILFFLHWFDFSFTLYGKLSRKKRLRSSLSSSEFYDPGVKELTHQCDLSMLVKIIWRLPHVLDIFNLFSPLCCKFTCLLIVYSLEQFMKRKEKRF